MYVKETVVAGETIEVRKYHTHRFCRKGQKRGVNCGKTSEAQAKINRRYAERTLRQLINANFRGGDLHLVLTYRKEDRPDVAGAKYVLGKFLRKLRSEMTARGEELKYMSVPPEKVNGAIHHHLIVNVGDIGLIRRLWPYGGVHPSVLDDSGNYAALARYIIKETDGKIARGEAARAKAANGEDYCGRRWSCSRNLTKPEVRKEIVKADTWRETPVAVAGYVVEIDSIVTRVNEEGYAEQNYMMRRIVPVSRGSRQKRRRSS